MAATFYINGKEYQVQLQELPADITLNTFLREHAGLTGTKFMCQEGGCGVCICNITKRQQKTNAPRTIAVNSCLTLLNSCLNSEITTIEGLGSRQAGYHVIQQRLAKMHGSQCGYCSPAMCMNMHALLQSHAVAPTMNEVENAFGGNLCRCTGYRSILAAMKSFAADSDVVLPPDCRDIEDLSMTNCCIKGAGVGVTKPPSSLTYADGSSWHWPQTLAAIFDIFKALKCGEQYMLVAGNTAHGVYRRARELQVYIDVNGVAELQQFKVTAHGLMVGGNLSLSQVMEIFEGVGKERGFEYCGQLWQHFDLIANVAIRNLGTLAGNLSLKHQHREFPSDVFTVLAALNAKIVVNESASVEKVLSLTTYLNLTMEKKVITALILPRYAKQCYIFDIYKVMPRAQNAHAYVNAAFLLESSTTNQITKANICFGGLSADLVHLESIENLLIGQELFKEELLLNKVFSVMQKELKASAMKTEASPEYRQKLAITLFYKFLLKQAPAHLVNTFYKSGGEPLKRDLSAGVQRFETMPQSYPVTKPVAKHEGLMQTAGEALYANDLSVQAKQVWAAFVTAKEVGASIANIDATAALSLPGVVAFYTAADIPGANNISGKESLLFAEPEELFASGTIKFYNQPIGVIVAETHALANEAAALVRLTYIGTKETVLATLKSVLQHPTAAAAARIVPTIVSPISELKAPAYDLSGTGELQLGAQYHFFMEPHTAIALPIEGGLELHVATQWLDVVQEVVGNMLGLRAHAVQVRVRRLGGGFGGKITRANLTACAAALAAFKLQRPVRFVQTLESMMNIAGKRWPSCSAYEFFVKSSGRVVALRNSCYEDAGYLANDSPMYYTQLVSQNCYALGENFKFDGSLVITDTPSNTHFRGPGSLEGIAMIENIMEHIAFALELDAADVRFANIAASHRMKQLFPRFLESTQYRSRKELISQFNTGQRWRKQGLGVSIMEYHIGYFGQYAATVAIYHNDGSVLISHGGIEMGQGLNTKVAQVAAHVLQSPLAMIKFEPSNSMNGANTMLTGGSVGSESLCFAVRKCCEILKARLEPLKAQLKNPTWPTLISNAYANNINLIASDACKPDDMQPYTICGLALSEVELDVLTGNYLLKRVDILEEVGESLNPAIDIGQIEGAFVMGLGYWTTEQLITDSSTGELLTNRSWNYKIPGAKDIPVDFRIELLPGVANQGGFMRSKTTGEPAISLAVSVAFALQEALHSARKDAGLKRAWVTLNAPMTPEYVFLNAGTDIAELKLK